MSAHTRIPNSLPSLTARNWRKALPPQVCVTYFWGANLAGARRARSTTTPTGAERGIRDYTVALLCSEEDPGACHRRLLIGRVLGERGVSVEHIRGDGRLQSEPEVAAEAGPARTDQMSLFEGFEELSWKSIPSVSPKRRPNSSSAF